MVLKVRMSVKSGRFLFKMESTVMSVSSVKVVIQTHVVLDSTVIVLALQLTDLPVMLAISAKEVAQTEDRSRTTSTMVSLV